MHSAGLVRVIVGGLLVGTLTATFGGCTRDPSPSAATTSGPVSAAGVDGRGTGPVGSATGAASRSPSVSVAPSTSTAPPPVVPVAARAHTDAGAEAFVRFYIDQLNLAWTTPAVRLVSALSEPDCISCASLEATAKQLLTTGRRYVSAPVSVRGATAYGGAPAGQQLVHLVLVQHLVDVVNSEGVIVTTDPPRDLTRNVVLKWRAEAWHVYGIA